MKVKVLYLSICWMVVVFWTFVLLPLQGYGQNGWESLNSGTAYHLRAVHFVDADNGYVIQDSPILLHTTNGGEDWTLQDSGVQANLKDVSFYDVARGVAVGLDSTIVYTVDSGEQWNIVQTGIPGAFHGAQMVTADMGVAVGINTTFQPHVAYTNNGWQTYELKSFYLHGKEEGMLTDVEFVDTTTGYAVGFNFLGGYGVILKTTSGGQRWKEIFRTPVPEQRFYGIDFVTPQLGFVVGEYGAVVKTEDGGKTWEKFMPVGLAPIWDVSFKNEYIGTIVGESGAVYRTMDGGETWSQQDLPVYTHMQGVSFLDPNVGYVVGINGNIFKTTDGGGCSLVADRYELPAGDPYSIAFSLFSGNYNGNRNYFLLASASGTSPGIYLPGGQAVLPLKWDWFTNIVIQSLNTPFFENFTGTLDQDGIGYAGINTFKPLPPNAVGLLLHFAYALDKPWDFVSIPIPIKIIP